MANAQYSSLENTMYRGLQSKSCKRPKGPRQLSILGGRAKFCEETVA